jgi:hypothetical protein
MELPKDKCYENVEYKFNKKNENTFNLIVPRFAHIMRIKHLFFELKDLELFNVDTNFEFLNKSRIELIINGDVICKESLLFLLNLNHIQFDKNNAIIKLPHDNLFPNGFITLKDTEIKYELFFELGTDEILDISANIQLTYVDSDEFKILSTSKTPILKNKNFIKNIIYDNREKKCNINIEFQTTLINKGYFIEGNLENLLKIRLTNNKTDIRFTYDKLMLIANSQYINKNLIYIPIDENYDYSKNIINDDVSQKESVLSFEFSESTKYINVHVY